MKPRRRQRSRGSAMVELAVSVPLLLAFFTSCFQFGYYFYVYNRLESAVRDGARYASLRPYNSESSTPAADFSTAVKNVVVYTNPSGGSQPVVPGLGTGNVQLTVTMNQNVPSLMQVSITGYQIGGIFGSWTLSGKPVAVFQYGSRMAPPNG